MIKVAIVDDHFFFRQGVRDVLNAEPDITVVAESGDGEEALEMVADLPSGHRSDGRQSPQS